MSDLKCLVLHFVKILEKEFQMSWIDPKYLFLLPCVCMLSFKNLASYSGFVNDEFSWIHGDGHS